MPAKAPARKPTKAQVEQECSEALAERNRAEARKLEAEARKWEADADIREMERAKAERQRLEEMASNRFHHVYRFDSEVSSKSVKDCMDQLDVWDRLDPNCAVTIVFTSPGGAVMAGMALWDYLTGFKQTHQLTTVAHGYAASMAGILLQAGQRRVIGAESYVLIHEVQAGAIGTMGEIEDEVEFLKKVQDRILGIFAERSKLTKAQLRNRWRRKNWWLDSAECLKLGIVDEVR